MDYKTRFFRAPKGLLNNDVIKVANNQGEMVTMWSITLEHHASPTPQEMAQRIIDNVTPGGIILMQPNS